MGVCKSKQSQNLTKSSEKLQSQPTNQKNTESKSIINQQSKSRHSLQLTNIQITSDKESKRRLSLMSPTSKPKTPQIITTNKQPLFDFQIGFFKKYSSLHTQQTDQVVIYQHNLTGQLARVTILSSLQQGDMIYLNKLKTYQQKCINICQIIEIYKEKQNIYIVQEYCKGGSLKQLIRQENLNYQQILLIMQQMIDALHHLHNQNLTHCHLTIDSFSISEPKNLVVKLSDINPLFISNYFESITHNSLKYDIALYKSPENDLNPSRDVWSLGAIFYELLTDQKLETPDKGDKKVNLYIDRSDCSEEIKQLIKQMLNINPQERITLQQIIQSGIFSQKVNSSSLQQCIQNLGKVKKMTYFQSIILYFMMIHYHQEEIQILTQLFNEADKDADNQLDKNELTNLYNVIIPDNPEFVSKQIDQIFLLMDVDNSGFISLNEFITAAANKEDLLNEDYLESCFKQIQNLKGGISIKSLQRKIEFDEEKLKDEFEDLTYDFIYYSQFKELMQQLI